MNCQQKTNTPRCNKCFVEGNHNIVFSLPYSLSKSPLAISIRNDFEKFINIVGHPKLLNGLLHIEKVRLKGFMIKTSSGRSAILFVPVSETHHLCELEKVDRQTLQARPTDFEQIFSLDLI